MNKTQYLLVALIAAGCAPKLVVDQSKVIPPPEDAEVAVAAVVSFFHLRETPTVYWYGGTALDCSGGTGYTSAWNGACVSGEQDGETVIVAYPDAWYIANTALRHEFGHLASDERGEGGDDGHCSHFFRDPGEACSAPLDDTHGDVGAAQLVLSSLGY